VLELLLAQLPAEPATGLPTLVDRITLALLGPGDADDEVCVLAFARAAGGA
jgi:hypothetical protein